MTTTAKNETTQRVTTRLGDLHVRIAGTGPATVLWPSMFVDSHTWDALLPLLPQDRRYVLVDGPGLGLSAALTEVADIDGAAAAALDLLGGLGVDAPVDWVGNAFGGHVGYKLGAMPGVLRSLVSISAPAEPIPADLRRQIGLLKPLLRLVGPAGPVRTAIIGAMLTDRSAADPVVRQVVLDSLRRPHRASLSRALESFILRRVDVTAGLAAIAVPCLYVASDDRGDWSPEDAVRAARATPNATAVTVSGARTLVPLEQPEAVAVLLRDFWDGLASS
ncbi:pimeloyl-ACP methyl ester carboxylesterase [Marmoricola sp. OAE513]|uniref:alpha/beta fold hydrolase n=1 Tax=Marmoricola sp. OAE513 TaxID=2817894 RepID=UPI001AEADD32